MLGRNDFWRAYFTPVRRLSDVSELERIQVLAATEAYFLDLASPMEVHGVCNNLIFLIASYITCYFSFLKFKKLCLKKMRLDTRSLRV